MATLVNFKVDHDQVRTRELLDNTLLFHFETCASLGCPPFLELAMLVEQATSGIKCVLVEG